MPMKKIIFALLAVLIFIGCATTAENGMTKAEKKAQQIAKVKKMLDERYYKVDIHMMHPQAYPARQVSYGYSLSIHGDSILSYLPYLGRAYRVPYGGGKGLHFDALIDDYREGYIKDDVRRIENNNGSVICGVVLNLHNGGKNTVCECDGCSVICLCTDANR